MVQPVRQSAPWFLWPFAALWDLLSFVLRLTGRLVAGVLGVMLLIIGILISITVVGAPVGIPISILGLLLLTRSLF